MCAFFRRDVTPTPDELSLVKTIAIAVGIEEKRRFAEATTARQAKQMAALYETSLEIGAQRDLTELLGAVVRRAASIVGAPMGGLHLMELGRTGLELVVSHNLPGVYAVGSRVALGAGLAGRVARTGEPLMVEDYAAWPGKAPLYEDSGIRRMLGVPLKIGEKVLGVLHVGDDQQAGPFSEDDVRLVSLFADQAAIALENTRLYAGVPARACRAPPRSTGPARERGPVPAPVRGLAGRPVGRGLSRAEEAPGPAALAGGR